MYYVLGRSPKPGRWIQRAQGDIPDIEWSDWRCGGRLAEAPPDPLLFTLKPVNPHASDHGPDLPSFLNAACPLFKTLLVDELAKCGVDNLDAYNVLVRDPDSGVALQEYLAVNIIGLISAADMQKSDSIIHPGGPPLVDVGFDRLVVDQSRAGNVKLFRLAESTKTILVHESVRDHLLSRGFADLSFHRPESVAI